MKYDPEKIYQIPISKIFADDDFNSRGLFGNQDVTELARDIKINGLNFPVIVEPWLKENGDQRVVGKDFRLISGYRRFRAHQINEAPTIRAMVKEGLNDLDARILNLSENLNRKDLTIDQEAKAIKPFTHWDIKTLAKRIGRNVNWVQSRIDYIELPGDIQDEVKNGVIDQHMITELAALPTEMQYKYVREVKDKILLGKKRNVDPVKIKANVVKEYDGRFADHRTQDEIFEMQDHVRAIYGNGLGTKLLAWTAKEISSLEMHRFLRDDAKREGKFHMIPEKHKLVGVDI